jgi:hypothetical protein
MYANGEVEHDIQVLCGMYCANCKATKRSICSSGAMMLILVPRHPPKLFVAPGSHPWKEDQTTALESALNWACGDVLIVH